MKRNLLLHLLSICVGVAFSSVSLYLTDKENTPKTVNDVKLINAGKILENNRTLGESRLPVGELPGMIITMHVVLRPPTLDKKTGNFFVPWYLTFRGNYFKNVPGKKYFTVV